VIRFKECNLVRFILLVSFFLVSAFACAQTATVRGSATINYKGEALSPDAKAQAVEKAKLSAVEKYFAQAGESEMENFDRNVDKIRENLGRFFTDEQIVDEKTDIASKRYSVVVRGTIFLSRLRNVIKSTTAVAAGSGEKSTIVFVFVGRDVDSVKSFDARVVKQERSSSSRDDERKSLRKGKESEDIRANSISTSAKTYERNSVSGEVTSRSETGGSTTRRKAQVTRTVFETNDLNVSIKKVFAVAGFNVKDADLVLPEDLLKRINQEFASRDKLAPRSKKEICSTLQQEGIPYFAEATLDVGMQDSDPATGHARFNVSITGEILDGQCNTVSAVQPTQIIGVHPDPDGARRQALARAAERAARELVSQMNVQGVR
jgi:hypothetical protein